MSALNTSFSWEEFLRIVIESLSSKFMAEMQERREATGSVPHTLGKVDAAALYALVRIAKPRRVLETGTFRGMSAAFILQALHDAKVPDFKVTSIDRCSGDDVGILVPEHLRSHLELLTGEIGQMIREEGAIPGEIDFFFHDSSHRYDHQLWEFNTFWPRIVDGGYLVSHDVNMNSSFAEFLAKTYSHTDGKTDWAKSGHSDWGRFGMVGFIRKSRDSPICHGT